jgi:hypothetical protein
MRTLLIVMALLLPSAAAAATCSATRGGSEWSWRLIDGKKCWYRGKPGMSKSSLHWAAAAAAEPSKTARVGQARPASLNANPKANPMYLDCVQSGGDRCDSLRTGAVPQDESALTRWLKWLRVPLRQ